METPPIRANSHLGEEYSLTEVTCEELKLGCVTWMKRGNQKREAENLQQNTSLGMAQVLRFTAL